MKYTADQIKQWEVYVSYDGRPYVPARPLDHTMESISSRIKNAFGVLLGRYDALDWEEKKGGAA